MKKSYASLCKVLALTTVLIFSITGCGGKSTESVETETSVVETTVEETTTAPETTVIESSVDISTEASTESSSLWPELYWPTSGMGALLPEPKSGRGKLLGEDAYSLYVQVGDTPKADFVAYIEACKTAGFTVDLFNGGSFYFADNADGYRLSMNFYEDKDQMDIMLEAPDEETSAEETTTASETTVAVETTMAVETTVAPETTAVSSTNNDIRPEIKDAIDSYEAFFNEYCEFMQKYKNSSNSVEMLSDYAAYMQQYTETMDKMTALQNSSLTAAELVYFNNANARIYAKLATIE